MDVGSWPAPFLAAHGSVTRATPSQAAGASMSISLTLHVPGIHNTTLTGTGTATSTTPDPNSAYNTASARVRVE